LNSVINQHFFLKNGVCLRYGSLKDSDLQVFTVRIASSSKLCKYAILNKCWTWAGHITTGWWNRGTGAEHNILNLYNILRTVNTQHTSRQDAIITIRLYLATCSGRKRLSSGQLRTILRYSKNSTQWDPISFTLKLENLIEYYFTLP